jgi:aminoglycoside phosphotransferase (APT) family kinase protein
VPTPRTHAAAPRLVRRLRTVGRLVRARLGRPGAGGRPPTTVRAHPSDLVPRRPVLPARVPREATLVLARDADLLAVPRWVRDVVRDAGLDAPLDGWAFAPPRGYRSQKVLYLLGPEGAEPRLVVKATQEPRFNARLDNEADALRRIAAEGLAAPATVPAVLATARHAGLSVVVESAWAGQPFRELSTARPDCPFAATALDWFTLLAERSAAPDTRPAAQRRAEIDDLVARYLDLHEVGARRREALLDHAATLGEASVPTVFFHGDPGNWNLRARPDGTVGVLDWENAHPAGPPVWDVALFLATYGTFVAEAQGRRWTAEVLVEQLRPGSALRPLVDRTLTTYGRRVGVAPAAIASLQVLCWVHQALKEASRRPVGAPPTGRQHEIVGHLLDDATLVEVRGSW